MISLSFWHFSNWYFKSPRLFNFAYIFFNFIFLVSKWIELSKNPTGQSNDDPLLSHVDLEIKLTSSSHGGKIISLYITKWDKKTNPIGLIRGAKVRFYQIQKMVSKKLNSYLVTTLLSTYDILDVNPYLDPKSHQRLYEQPVNFLFELPENSSEAFHCCFTGKSQYHYDHFWFQKRPFSSKLHI